MLNFDAHKQKDLQHFVQMLNQCEAEGKTDIRFIREALHKHLYPPQTVRPARVRIPQTSEPKCPDCDGVMYPAKGEKAGEYVKVEGRAVLVCGKCRYSEVQG